MLVCRCVESSCIIERLLPPTRPPCELKGSFSQPLSLHSVLVSCLSLSSPGVSMSDGLLISTCPSSDSLPLVSYQPRVDLMRSYIHSCLPDTAASFIYFFFNSLGVYRKRLLSIFSFTFIFDFIRVIYASFAYLRPHAEIILTLWLFFFFYII